MDTQLLKVEDVCDDLNVGRSTVYGLIGSGELKSIKIGRSRRITASSLREFIETKQSETEAGE